ncbi:MAG TPA: hypothetical protein VMP00_06155 [Burkholderiales bacterium]|nr:hypothetical protein [Burkholderiales bacterium]
MRKVQLELLQTVRRSSGGGIAVLVAGIAAALIAMSYYGDLKSESLQLESQAAGLERSARGLAPILPRMDESLQQEIREANEVIDRLALPWDGLFRSVEDAATDRVTLLGIAPDAKSGTVQISAQAVDTQAMFDYVGKLEQQSELSQVYLLQHQQDRRNTEAPIRFLVSASWMRH